MLRARSIPTESGPDPVSKEAKVCGAHRTGLTTAQIRAFDDMEGADFTGM